MKKKFLLAFVFNAWLVGLVAAQLPAEFAGSWALDMKKTRELPPKLEGLTLSVSQREQRLLVETKVAGELKPRDEADHAQAQQQAAQATATANSHVLSGAAGGISEPGTGGMSGASRAVVAHGAAIGTVIPRISYPLDGQEAVTHLQGQRPSNVRRKLQWREPGKRLELFVAREFDDKRDPVPTTLREQWELIDGGKTLKITRTINNPNGWDKVTLFFNKVATP